MSLDDELERLELALDDHYGGYENLVSSLEDTEDAQNALRHLAEIVEVQNLQAYSSEQAVKGISDYLIDNRNHMDTKALELKRDQDKLEDVLENYGGGNRMSRRALLAGGAGLFATAAFGGAYLGTRDSDTTGSQTTDFQMVEASISDVEGLGNYLEDLSSRELQEWSALANQYDESSGEFFPDQDINLQGIDLIYNEDRGEKSGYRTNAEIAGDEEQYSVWQWFEHDETAKDALEHFGEL